VVDDVVSELRQNMDKSVDAFKRELAKVRTGRASAALLDGIKIEYYGSMSPLAQVATLAVPDARLITIKPWDKSLIPTIEKAIQAQAELGLNPNSDGELIRIPIPPLTQERRKELVKLVKKMGEDAKVAVRNHRRDANDTLKEFQKSGDISEDDSKNGLKKVQDVTDKFVTQLDTMVVDKEKEILEG